MGRFLYKYKYLIYLENAFLLLSNKKYLHCNNEDLLSFLLLIYDSCSALYAIVSLQACACLPFIKYTPEFVLQMCYQPLNTSCI